MNQVRPFQNQQLNQMEIVVGTYESSETIANQMKEWAGPYEPSETLSKSTAKSNGRMSRSRYIWTKWDPCKTNSLFKWKWND